MKFIHTLPMASFLVVGFVACTAFHDNLEPCPPTKIPEPDPEPQEISAELTFLYDYHLEKDDDGNYVDKFDDEVHCIELFIFDKATGKIVGKPYRDAEKGNEGNYSVSLSLYPGEYTAVVYGGTACSEATFHQVKTDADIKKITDLSVEIKGDYFFPDNSDSNVFYKELSDEEHSNLRLHRLFYGTTGFTIEEETKAPPVSVVPMQVPMQRNTNIVTVNLTHKNHNIARTDYHFAIEDDNNSYDWQNNIKKTGKIYYRPWLKEEDETDNKISAEFTVSRLMHTNDPMLYIKDADLNDVITPLNLVSEALQTNNTGLENQEYLDRRSSWEVNITIGDDPTDVEIEITVLPWEYNQSEKDI